MDELIQWNDEGAVIQNICANMFVLLTCFGFLSGCSQAILRTYTSIIYEYPGVSLLGLILNTIIIISASCYYSNIDIFLLWVATVGLLTMFFMLQQRLLATLTIFTNVFFIGLSIMAAIYYFCVYAIDFSMYILWNAVMTSLCITCFAMPHLLKQIYILVFHLTEDIATIIFVDYYEIYEAH